MFCNHFPNCKIVCCYGIPSWVRRFFSNRDKQRNVQSHQFADVFRITHYYSVRTPAFKIIQIDPSLHSFYIAKVIIIKYPREKPRTVHTRIPHNATVKLPAIACSAFHNHRDSWQLFHISIIDKIVSDGQ